MLDDAGIPGCCHCRFQRPDEFLIHDLKMQGATQFLPGGVGTNLITSKDCPSLAVFINWPLFKNADGEFQPKIKISENIEKITNPGNKTIYRIYDKETGMHTRWISSASLMKHLTQRKKICFSLTRMQTWKKTLLPGGTYTMRELLVLIFQHEECKYESPSVKEIAEFLSSEKKDALG